MGNLFAQHRGDNWAISDSIMLSFSQTGVTVSNSVLHSSDSVFNSIVEGMATISDETGQLDFYTNGATVWNSNHQMMTNGDGLQCNFSTTNGVVIVPYPDHDSLYYIFYINWPLTAGNSDKGFSYSLVNMYLDNGLGGIVNAEKNISLILGQTLTEKVCAVKHGNGRDWWIVGHDLSNNFFEYLVTPNGIEGPFWNSIGLNQEGYYEGEICFSPQGNKLAMVNGFSVEVFDFDRCTGALSNEIILDSVLYSNSYLPDYYGGAFSPDESKFYVSCNDQINYGGLYQFNLSNSNPHATKTLIWGGIVSAGYGFAQMELAPDDNIYLVIVPFFPDSIPDTSQLNLSIIESPNSLGTSCDLILFSLYLNGHRLTLGLPNMPNYNLGALGGSACDTLTSIQNKNLKTKNIVSIYPNPSSTTINISSSNLSGKYSLKIYNLLGQQVKQQEIDFSFEGSSKVNIESLASGYYQLMLVNGSNVVSKRFVKE